jgi:LacI family transcriptional regulator
MPLIDSVAPPMTTVHVSLFEMGVHAAAMMLEMLEGRRTGDVSVVLTPELVVRESTATHQARGTRRGAG